MHKMRWNRILVGNVGIGTTVPANVLSVVGAAAIGTAAYAETAAPSNGLIVSGNTGIGTPSPNYRLHVEQNVAGNWTALVKNTGDGYGLLVITGGTTDEAFDVRPNGVGSTFLVKGNGVIQMIHYGAGTATFDASGNISSVSDERLKNIQGNLKYGLKEILQIHPILFKWNKKSGLETDHIYTGFSAQEIQKLIPETVGQGKDGYLSLSDRGIEGALVNATKELDRKVEAQNAQKDKEIADLNARNKEFEERLKELEEKAGK